MKIYTSKEAAQELGLAMNSMRKYAVNYQVGMKKGRDWLFTDKDLKEIKKHIGKRGRPRSIKSQ